MNSFLDVDAGAHLRGVHLTLSVNPGEIVAVVGPNGAGKSTLLKLIAGELRADSGSITFNGATLSGEGIFVPPHRRRFSYVEQRALLFPHLNVLDNVAFGLRSRGVERKVARARAMQELAAVGCEELALRRAHELSGGQAQRVSIARALAVDPQIMLLDEPFAGLDQSITPQVRRLLHSRLQEKNQTALIVTHDLLDVVMLADQIVVIEEGRVITQDSVAAICAQPPSDFMAHMVGLNLIEGHMVGPDRLQVGSQVISGMSHDEGSQAGEESGAVGKKGRAVIAPAALSVHRSRPGGSPRNALVCKVQHIESQGPIVVLTCDFEGQTLRAELTAQPAAELGFIEGDEVMLVAKAVQVQLWMAQ